MSTMDVVTTENWFPLRGPKVPSCGSIFLLYSSDEGGQAMSEYRKLAAILVAAVVGYSRLVSEDEDRTLAMLRALRSDLIDPTVAARNGRVVKRTGDGTLVEFRSVVDAVRCAVDVQNGLVEFNAGVPRDRHIKPALESIWGTWLRKATAT